MPIDEIIFSIFSFYFDQIFGAAPYPPTTFVEGVVCAMAVLPTIVLLILALIFRFRLKWYVKREIEIFPPDKMEENIKLDQKNKIFVRIEKMFLWYFPIFLVLMILGYFIGYQYYDEGVDFISFGINAVMYVLLCSITFVLLYYILININPPFYIKAKLPPFWTAKFKIRR